MSDSRNRTDSLLDEIDQLVEDSLSRGDQSDSFHGEQYDRCELCGDHWHYLAITQTMAQMRRGSYGQDEFGYPIVDPDYSYSEDTSAYVCPGSTFLAPPTSDREWEWYVKHWKSRSPSHQPHYSGGSDNPIYRPSAGTNPRTRTWRFRGDWSVWSVECTVDVVYAQLTPWYLPRPVEQRNYATFAMNGPVEVQDNLRAFVEVYRDDVDQVHYQHGQYPLVSMKPIKFEYQRMEAVQAIPGQQFPDYVDFVTTYPIEAHTWWMQSWELITPPSLVAFDEAYEMSDQAL